MQLRPCCEERRMPIDIALEDGEYYCKRCGLYLGRTFMWNYRDFQNYNFRRSLTKPYNPRNHASHVLNCLECKQTGKPSFNVLNKLKKGGTSKEDLYCNVGCSMRKHLTYIWCELNNVPYLNIDPEHRMFLLREISKTPKSGLSRKSYHKIIYDIIQENPHLDYISRYLTLFDR